MSILDKARSDIKSRAIECITEVDGSPLKSALLLVNSDKRIPDYLILVVSDSFIDKDDPFLMDFLRYVYSKNFKFHFLDASNQHDARQAYQALESKIRGFYNNEQDLVVDKSNKIYDLHLVFKFKEYSEERFLMFQNKMEEATLKLEAYTKNQQKNSLLKKIKSFLESLCR